MALTTRDETTEPLDPSTETTETPASPRGESPRKHDTFDPYKFGKIQFTTKFFRKLVAEPLPEADSDSLIRPEDLVRPSAESRRSSYPPAAIATAPSSAKTVLMLPLIAVGAFALVGTGMWLFAKKGTSTEGEPKSVAVGPSPSNEPAVAIAPAVVPPVAPVPVVASSTPVVEPKAVEPVVSATKSASSAASPAATGGAKKPKSGRASGPKPPNGVYFDPD